MTTKTMTFDEAETMAASLNMDLSHDCDERATECVCEWSADAPEGHAAGDTRCPNRAQHSACSHDRRALGR